MAAIIRTLLTALRLIFGSVAEKQRRRESEERVENPAVELKLEYVVSEGVAGTIHPNPYRIELNPDGTAKEQKIEIRLGLAKLLANGMTALKWEGSSLRPVDVELPAVITYYFAGKLERVKTKIRNASSPTITLHLEEGFRPDGFYDKVGSDTFFHVNHLIDFDLEFLPVDGIEIAYKGSPTGYAAGYFKGGTFKDSALLYETVKLAEAETEAAKEDIDDRPMETVVSGMPPKIIRTSPSIHSTVRQIEETYRNIIPPITNLASTTIPHITIQIDDRLVTPALLTAVKVNGNPVALFSTETPYRWVDIPVNYGERYDIDITMAVKGAIYPPAVLNPALKIEQSRLVRWGWLFERNVAQIIGQDSRSITPLPIGLASASILADRVDRSYSVYITAEKIGKEEWAVRGKVRYDEDGNLVFENISIVSRVEGLRHGFPIPVSEDMDIDIRVYGERGSEEQIHGPVYIAGEPMWLLKTVNVKSKDLAKGYLNLGRVTGRPKQISVDAACMNDGLIWSKAHIVQDIEFEV